MNEGIHQIFLKISIRPSLWTSYINNVTEIEVLILKKKIMSAILVQDP